MKKRKGVRRLDFLPNKNNKYSIRKFTIGTASILIGSTLVFGLPRDVEAAETASENVNTTNESSQTKDTTPDTASQDITPTTESNEASQSETLTSQQPSSDKTENTLTQPSNEPTQESSSTETPSQEDSKSEETASSSTESSQANETSSQNSESTNTSDSTQDTSTEETPTQEESTAPQDSASSEDSTQESQSTTESKDAPTTIPNNQTGDKGVAPDTSEATRASYETLTPSIDNTKLTDSLKTVSPDQKETEAQTFLTKYVSEEEAQKIVDEANIDFTTATDQQINEAVLFSAVQNLSDQINQSSPEAVPMTSFRMAAQPAFATTVQEPNRQTYTIPDDPKYLYLLRDLGYNATTVKDNTQLRFSGIGQSGDQMTNKINLNLTKWLNLQSEFVNGGQVHLSFNQPKFFNQIESITINGVQMTTTNNGQDWSAPISSNTVKSSLIGVVTNTPVVITLKNNQTLESLGFSNENPVYLTHTWTTNNGEIAAESIQQTLIKPKLDSQVPQTTQSSGFLTGRMVNTIRYNQDENAIKSVHLYKPDENFLQTDYDWLLYIKEQVPKQLLPYIDLSSIKLYVSDEYGNPISKNRYVNISADATGLVDTSQVSLISIMQNQSLSQLNAARGELDANVFYGTLGQSRAYTISYKLKNGVTMEQIAKQVNQNATTTSEARLNFASWLESDYLDKRVIGKSDGGAPHNRILGSYATSFIDFYDYDGDGIPDIADTSPGVNNEDTTPPDAPVIQAIESGSQTVTGTGESGATVKVTFPNGQTSTSTVQSNGTWTVAVPSNVTLKIGDTVKVTATDAAGNKSPESVAQVFGIKIPNPPTINHIEAGSKVISGTGVVGNQVTVTLPGGEKETATVGADGTWTINIPSTVSLNDNDVVSAIQNDGQNNSGAYSVIVKDTIAPNAPLINAVEAGTTQISGQGENGSLIVVTFPDGQTALTSVDEHGNWTVDVPLETPLPVVGDVIKATSIDNADNTSENTIAKAVDTTAPDTPGVLPVELGETTVTGTGEPGATVDVLFKDGTVKSAQVNQEGVWTLEATSENLQLNDSIIVTQTDPSQNTSLPVEVTVKDTVPPEAPGVESIEANAPQVKGTSEPNAHIILETPDGKVIETDADRNGNWTADVSNVAPLQDGSIVVVRQQDASSNTSPVTRVTVKDTVAPEAPTFNEITSSNSNITGTAEPNSTVSIKLPNDVELTVQAQQDGSFSVAIPEGVDLAGGETVQATATDAVGNISQLTTTTVKDTTPPDSPIILPISSNDTTISGIAEPNNTINIKMNGQSLEPVQSDETGRFTVNIPTVLNGGEIVTATSTDQANNTSTENTTTVSDETQPEAPTVNKVTSEDTIITGTAEPNSTVTIKFPNRETAVGEADTNGKYTINIPSTIDLRGGETIVVTATDTDGNTSPASETIVEDQTAPNPPTVNPITSESTTVTGTAEPNSTVLVTLPGGSIIEATTEANGQYSVDFPDTLDLKGGETITVVAKDNADNTSTSTVNIVEDVTPPNAPTINPVTSNSTVVTGTAEPNSTVTIAFPDGTQFETIANASGQYYQDISSVGTLTGGERVTATAKDEAGNTSDSSSAQIIDKTAPDAPSVSEIHSTDKSIAGTAEPNSTVEVVFPDQTSKTTTTDNTGKFEIDMTDAYPLLGGEELIFSATDSAGNKSEPSSAIVLDTTPPKTPTIETVKSTDTTLKGQAEPNTIVTVTFPNGDKAIGATDRLGQFDLEMPPNVNLKGGEVLTVTSTDGAGNTSEETTTTVEDQTAPEAPTVNPVTSKTEAITGTGEAGSKVTVTFPDGITATGTVDEEGRYEVKVPDTVDLKGGETIKATLTDKAGNTSEATSTIVEDQTAPEAPTVDSVTSETEVITGTGEAGSTVTVTFPDGTTATGTVDEEGHYEVKIPDTVDLKGGETIKVTTTDEAGNQSEETTTIVEDKSAPEAPTVDPVTSETEVITGTGEAGSKVTVTFPDGTTATGTVDEEGRYEVTIPATVDLKGGETIKVTSTDKAGNTSEETTTTVEDKSAPEAPTVNPVTSKTEVITGTGEVGSTVTVTFPDGTTATGTVNGEGRYEVRIPDTVDLKGGETIKVTLTDKAGNTSEETTTTVEDKSAPEAPTVNPVTSETEVITGTGEAGSKVTVTFPDGTTTTGTVNGEGRYEVKIPDTVDLKGGETIKVTTTDEAGNQSEETTTTVEDKSAPDTPTVDPVTSETEVITGTGEAGSTVTVTFPDGTTATGTVDEEGRYEVKIPDTVDLKGGEVLTVTSTDEAGNKSEETSITVEDQTAPEAPTVDPVTSETEVITGTGEAGSKVTVTFPDGTTITGTVDEEGRYEVKIPDTVGLKGGETIKVTLTDSSGNVSKPTEMVVAQDHSGMQNKPPKTDEPTSPGTSDAVITGVGKPGSTVIVTFPDGTTATGIVKADGSYEVKVPNTVNTEDIDIHKVKVSITTGDGTMEHDSNVRNEQKEMNELPETGVGSNPSIPLIGSLATIFGGLLLLLFKRRKKKEESDKS
ncbi:Ig-like domain-containing protein [Staphylococcus felis]|uniref:Ig-like domain-containing protein n=1 Tax=Staphylococcus felis TaxID=46127 RepID=UPI0021D0795D|nr:Ig-like domain-containing protein [Staphylococcus felis]UXR87086.1 Ig-like domain-containing protein [Staphylococcus felis]